MLYFFRNASTRPAVSTILSRPVKNGWQLAHTAIRMLGTVERVCTVAPQVHVISVSMDAGWCEICIGPPLTAAFSACYVCEAAADTSVRSFSAKTCLGTTPTVLLFTEGQVVDQTVGVVRGQMRVVVHVHLPHRGLSVKLDGQLLNRWRQDAARTAPRRPEIDQDRL